MVARLARRNWGRMFLVVFVGWLSVGGVGESERWWWWIIGCAYWVLSSKDEGVREVAREQELLKGNVMEREKIECEAGVIYVLNSLTASMSPPGARARDWKP